MNLCYQNSVPKDEMPKHLKKISKGMKDRGYNRDLQQCCVKRKALRQIYQKTREANGRSGSEPQTCQFYDELHAILGGAATTIPPLCFDSVNGLSRNRDAHFGDEEDEEEVEDSAQQVSRETVSPDSQELFITLEPIPPEPTQGRLPDPPGGEGTSAANVSTLPLSSSSQRLAKIRRFPVRSNKKPEMQSPISYDYAEEELMASIEQEYCR
ncbi:cystin-1 isoform X1 [Lepidochelys kempii]|uniref:cystin-1 isoform X1 n=1 Tax=Lepidochelys kempii TaxID=8472 RepID=UPI003C6F13B3